MELVVALGIACVVCVRSIRNCVSSSVRRCVSSGVRHCVSSGVRHCVVATRVSGARLGRRLLVIGEGLVEHLGRVRVRLRGRVRDRVRGES